MKNNTYSRRGFLKLGTQALASSTLLATLGGMERALAASDTNGYRALVCVFLYGGHDSFNWIIPTDNARYATYAASRGRLALPRDDLRSITPSNVGGGAQFALHPSCQGIQSLFNNGNAAFIANVGPLVRPVTVAQIRNDTAELPPHLFSHSDQSAQWMTSYPQSGAPYGWSGRIADLLKEQGYNPRLAMNVSLAGNNIWQGGQDTVQYALGTGGAPELNAVSESYYRDGARSAAFLDLLQQARGDAHLLTAEFARTQNRAIDLAQFINASLESSPALTTAFPQSYLGAQLRMAARMIRARESIGVSRQMFFVGVGGWDTHDNQLIDQSELLFDLSTSLQAFQSAMNEINAQDLVTTFTASDFGRTLTSNGDGSDHGWGAHALVMGGAVKGRAIYGTMPNLTIEGPNDAGEGRIVPTTGTDQYAATLAKWFGVSDSDLRDVFPNLGNFASANMGFMS